MTKHLIHENCTLNVKMQELSTAASNGHQFRICNPETIWMDKLQSRKHESLIVPNKR
jgi:hypothetical protein